MRKTRLIFVCGNDGSGKSSYINHLLRKNNKIQNKIISRHYYDNPLRKFLRIFINPRKYSSESKAKNIKKKYSFFLKYFFFIYTITIIVLIRTESLFRLRSTIIYDRSFIDEMISFEVLNNQNIKMNWYILMFKIIGKSRFIFLDANSEKKFTRMIDKDISKQLFLEKDRTYKKVFNSLIEIFKEKIEKINTDANK